MTTDRAVSLSTNIPTSGKRLEIGTPDPETAGQDFDFLEPISPANAPECRATTSKEFCRRGHTQEQGAGGRFGMRGRRPAFKDSVNFGLDLRGGLENLQEPVVGVGIIQCVLLFMVAVFCYRFLKRKCDFEGCNCNLEGCRKKRPPRLSQAARVPYLCPLMFARTRIDRVGT